VLHRVYGFVQHFLGIGYLSDNYDKCEQFEHIRSVFFMSQMAAMRHWHGAFYQQCYQQFKFYLQIVLLFILCLCFQDCISVCRSVCGYTCVYVFLSGE